MIRPGIPLPDQARIIARAKGFLGTSFDYLSDTHERLKLLEIEDDYISELYEAAKVLRDTST